VKSQASVIRAQAKQIKMHEQKIAMLESTIRELRSGSHDMELSGESQTDMEHILREFNADPALAPKMYSHDSTNTLKLFWYEQVCDHNNAWLVTVHNAWLLPVHNAKHNTY